MIAFALPVYTQTQGSNTVSKDHTVTFLIDQNEKARALVDAEDAHIKDLEAQVSAEQANGESLSKSYAAALNEIDALKAANDSLHKALDLNQQTIALITADRDKWRDKARHERNSKLKAYAVAAGVIALKFLLP
jgi:hypothetical protein